MAIQIQSDLPAARESWLSRDRLGRERQIEAGGWKTYVGFYNQAAAIVRKTSRWMFAYRTGGQVMSIAPTLMRYLTAENIQYAEIPRELTMSFTRTAEACLVSGD